MAATAAGGTRGIHTAGHVVLTCTQRVRAGRLHTLSLSKTPSPCGCWAHGSAQGRAEDLWKDHPPAEWTAQRIVNAFPWGEPPRYLLRGRDGVYGQDFRKRVRSMCIEEVIIAAQSPWQNAYSERLIGRIRWECLDHVIVLSEDHPRRVLWSYFS